MQVTTRSLSQVAMIHDYMLEKNWHDFARQFETWITSA